MAVVTIEQVGSRDLTVSVDAPELELIYMAVGSEEEQETRAAVERDIPMFYDLTGNIFNGVLCFQKYHVKHLGGDVWEVSAWYSRRIPRKPGEVQLNFDTGGGTQHIQQSKETVRSYCTGNVVGGVRSTSAPNFEGAINCNNDTVAGVDIGIKKYQWSETWWLSRDVVNSEYRVRLKNLSWTTNKSPFREFAAGEVLFKGASGAERDDDTFEMTYHFEQSDNATGLVVGDMTDIDKKGWELLWVLYEDAVDQSRLIKVPLAVYIERVYDEGDFALLGLGTLPLVFLPCKAKLQLPSLGARAGSPGGPEFPLDRGFIADSIPSPRRVASSQDSYVRPVLPIGFVE